MRIDPFALPVKARKQKRYKFTDDATGTVLEITFRALGPAGQLRVFDVAETLKAKYMTRKQMFPPVGGQPVDVSETLFRSAGMFYCMTVPDENERPYTPEDFVAMSVSLPDIWVQMADAVADLNSEEEEEGNEPEGEQSSGSPSTSSEGTPSSTSDMTPSSGPSTNGSATCANKMPVSNTPPKVGRRRLA